MNPILVWLLALVLGPILGFLLWAHLEAVKIMHDPEIQKRIEEVRKERQRKADWEAKKK